MEFQNIDDEEYIRKNASGKGEEKKTLAKMSIQALSKKDARVR